MAANFSDVVVVMVPFPQHGHQTPLLRLSRLISSYNIPVYFATIGEQISELKRRLKECKLDQFPNLHFHDLSAPPVAKSTRVVKECERDEALISSLQQLREPLSKLCCELSRTCRRLVLINDTFLLDCGLDVHHKLATKVEIYVFHAISAITLYSLIQQVTKTNDYDDLFLQIETHIPSIESCYPPGMDTAITKLQDCLASQYAGQIFNTSRAIEGSYLDALAKQSEKQVWALGPLNPLHVSLDKHDKCIEWLDKQPKHSVIFVSFGTASTFSQEQINELATGLERSDQKFIWVLRSKDKEVTDFTTDIPNIELPKGFEERVAERGIVARDWVPQLEILAHPSTGGYLFHSGWGSFVESVTMGVPMATWPLHVDNPYNDVLITKVLKVGLPIKDWAHKAELVTWDTIANALKTLMNSPEGDEIRQRAIELSKSIKMSVTDGGSTLKEMDSFIAHITR